MPHYTMFKADGVPVRSQVSVDGWRLEVMSSAHAKSAGAGKGLLAHELTHVVLSGHSVRAWLKKGHDAGPAAVRRPPNPGYWNLPEVDDEVLVTFANSTPIHTALAFNPTASPLSRSAFGPSHRTTAGGGARQGSFQVIVKEKGHRPLALELMVCPSQRFDSGVVRTRVM